MQCTSCMCDWEPDGFYTHEGELVQPCKVCRCDTSSIYYLNNHEVVRERQNKAYYRDHESRKAYYRDYRRQQRQQASL